MYSLYALSALRRAAACTLLLTTLASAASRTLDARTTCYSGVFTLVARGSEEAQGQSVLETIAGAITAAIPNSGSNEVVYPALLSFWDSAPTGVDNAQQQMQDYYSSCPDGKVILLGYSQGSFVLATSLADGNFSDQSWSAVDSDIGDNIAAVVLFGDQTRVPGQGTAATGTNCATTCNTTSPLQLQNQYASTTITYSDRLEEWCDDADPICCKTGWDINAHLSYWSDNTTDSVVQFVQSKVGSASSSSSTSSSASSSTSSSLASSTSTPSASLSASSSAASVTSSIEASLSSEVQHSSTATAPTATDFSNANASTAPTSAASSGSPSATASTSSGDRMTYPLGGMICGLLVGFVSYAISS